jgi:hypothetical protein
MRGFHTFCKTRKKQNSFAVYLVPQQPQENRVSLQGGGVYLTLRESTKEIIFLLTTTDIFFYSRGTNPEVLLFDLKATGNSFLRSREIIMDRHLALKLYIGMQRRVQNFSQPCIG